MKQVLQLRVSQHLALTPQLQQSIRLLQLSTLELNQEIEVALAENPLLERVDDPMHSAVQLTADGTMKRNAADEHFDASSSNYTGDVSSDAARDHSTDGADGVVVTDFEGGERRIDDLAATDWNSSERRNDNDDDDRDLAHVNTATVTLREHLLGQLALKKLNERDRGLVAVLIEALEEEGYLGDELEDILAMLPAGTRDRGAGAADRADAAAELRPAGHRRTQRVRMPRAAAASARTSDRRARPTPRCATSRCVSSPATSRCSRPATSRGCVASISAATTCCATRMR